MNPDTLMAARSHDENWLPILELAVEEVFEIMLGSRVTPLPKGEESGKGEFTAMVGLAGALCGIVTFSCDRHAAREVAKCMLGPEIADNEDQVSDALGEICNMIAGNFESGRAQMKSGSQSAFDRIAALLRQRDYRLRIEGHTDNVPIHNSQFSSNWELSTSRATEIVRLLIVRDGYGPNRLSAAGYAEYHPTAPNETAEGRAMNRRVDIVVLGLGVTGPPGDPSQANEGKLPIPSPANVSNPSVVPAESLPAKPSPSVQLKPSPAGAPAQ